LQETILTSPLIFYFGILMNLHLHIGRLLILLDIHLHIGRLIILLIIHALVLTVTSRRVSKL
jgi:hypothetical protein